MVCTYHTYMEHWSMKALVFGGMISDYTVLQLNWMFEDGNAGVKAGGVLA